MQTWRTITGKLKHKSTWVYNGLRRFLPGTGCFKQQSPPNSRDRGVTAIIRLWDSVPKVRVSVLVWSIISRRSVADSGRPNLPTPSTTVPFIEKVGEARWKRQTFSSWFVYNPPCRPSHAKLLVVSSTEPLSFKSLSQTNNIGEFTCGLSEFSADCAGKERHLLSHADGSWCPCGIGDSTASKGCSTETSPRSQYNSRHMKSPTSSVEGCWVLKRQIKNPVTLVLGHHQQPMPQCI